MPNDPAVRFSYQFNSIMVIFLLSLLGAVAILGANLTFQFPDWFLYTAITVEAAVIVWCFTKYMAARARYKQLIHQTVDPLGARVTTLKVKNQNSKTAHQP